MSKKGAFSPIPPSSWRRRVRTLMRSRCLRVRTTTATPTSAGVAPCWLLSSDDANFRLYSERNALAWKKSATDREAPFSCTLSLSEWALIDADRKRSWPRTPRARSGQTRVEMGGHKSNEGAKLFILEEAFSKAIFDTLMTFHFFSPLSPENRTHSQLPIVRFPLSFK